MLSQRYFITEPTNDQNWSLEEVIGHEFEDFIFNLLVLELDTLLEKNVRIEKTPGSRDDGKDIVLSTEIDLENIFNLDFYLRECSKIKIYFECKSSEKHNISYDSVLSKVSKVKNDNIQYYVLVTNKTIMPYTYYQIQEEFKQHNIEFYLVDQYLLYRILSHYKDILDFSFNVPDLCLPEKLYAEYQILSPQNSKKHQLYVLFRNYTPNALLFQLHLVSDWNWKSQPHIYKNVIEAWKYKVLCLEIYQKYTDGIEDLRFYLDSNSNQTVFKIKGIHASLNFEPFLCGKQHKYIKQELTQIILKKEFGGIRYLFGEAGTGKTRLIEEVLNNISGKNIISKYISCSNDKQTKQAICHFLCEQKLLIDPSINLTLENYFSRIRKSNKRFFLILDDIHNLTELLNEIKELYLSEIPEYIYILLIGRNDFSKGSIQYYNFLQYCRYTSKMKGYILECMDDEDAQILIKSLIQDIPNIVLERILKASSKNPLYIIQFTEYLLDLNLAHIVNRETVGIRNIDNFSNHLYIPLGIEKLYEERKDNLSILAKGNILQDILYILAFIEKPISIYILKEILNIRKSDINLLLFRKFIKFVNYDEKKIWFFHESLFLYFKQHLRNNLNILEHTLYTIYRNQIIFNELSSFQKGELLFYINRHAESKKFFAPIIDFCESIQNYTTCKTDISYLAYLDILFELHSETENVKFLQNCLIYKIYTILHFFTPVRAIHTCNEIEEKICHHNLLKKDTQFKNAISTLKCHSYVNAGQLKNAEISYQKLISNYILRPETIDSKSAFDMFDRLSGLYIRYNNYEAADHYNKIAENIAKSMKDDTLMGLVETTRAKLHFYNDIEKSYNHMKNAREYLLRGNATRNLLHNNITIAAYQVMYGNLDNASLRKWMSTAYDYLKISIENQYPSLIIRSYLLLGIISNQTDGPLDSYQTTLLLLDKGIDASIKFGLPSYIWMLYNLKFIISIKRKDSIEYIEKLAESIYRQIKEQNLLNWGCRDFTYGNIPIITNIARFYAEKNFESEFYKKISQIDYQNKGTSYDVYDIEQENSLSQYPDINSLREEYKRVLDGRLLYMDNNVSYKVTDSCEGYFIVFA